MLQRILGVFRIRMPTPRTREEIDARVSELMSFPWCKIDAELGASFDEGPSRHYSKYYRIVTPEERAKRREKAEQLLNSRK